MGTSLNQNQAYTYDALNRLKTAGETGSGTAWSQTYGYDRYGNRRVTPDTNGNASYRIEPGPDAAVDGRHRCRDQPAGRHQGSQHRRLRRSR